MRSSHMKYKKCGIAEFKEVNKLKELSRVAGYIADAVALEIFKAEENNYPVTIEFLWKQVNFYSKMLPGFGYEKLKVTEKENIIAYVLDLWERGLLESL